MNLAVHIAPTGVKFGPLYVNREACNMSELDHKKLVQHLLNQVLAVVSTLPAQVHFSLNHTKKGYLKHPKGDVRKS